MRRKYSRFIKILSVILVIVISSITNRYASEVKSLVSTSNHKNLEGRTSFTDQEGGSLYGYHPNEADAQKAYQDASEIFHNQTWLNNNLSDSQGKSIYSSLIKIVQNMKNQMDREKLESRMDGKKTIKNTMDMPLDLVRNIRPNQQTNNNQASGNSFNNLDLKTSRNTRNANKATTETPPIDIPTPPQDQYSDIFNEPLKENFNEVGGGLASMAEEETKTKKTTYSSFVSPPDPVASQININRKPSSNQYNEIPAANGGGGDLMQPMRTFSPRVEDLPSPPLPKGWGQQSTFYNELQKPFLSLTSNKNLKSRESFFTPTQDVSFNDYDQHLTNGFSPAYNEPPSFQQQSTAFGSSGETEDSPMLDSMPILSAQGISSNKAKRNKIYLGKHRLQGPSFSPLLDKHSNSRYVVDNEYLTTAQLEQQEDDGSRWPKVPAPEFQDSLRASRGKPDYGGIHLQQINPPISSTNTYHNQPNSSGGRNKRQRNHRHQAQQQQVYYSVVSPPQSGLKSLTSSRTLAQSNPGPIYEVSPPSSGSQPQRDLLNQPQTIQLITAIPNANGFNNNPSPFFRNNAQVNNGGMPIALLNNGALIDPTGRQVVMVNSDRRQIDWSFLIWPLLVVVVLPLVLSALFVPIFMKSLVLFIQILQSLGLIMPISSALGLTYATGASLANATSS